MLRSSWLLTRIIIILGCFDYKPDRITWFIHQRLRNWEIRGRHDGYVRLNVRFRLAIMSTWCCKAEKTYVGEIGNIYCVQVYDTQRCIHEFHSLVEFQAANVLSRAAPQIKISIMLRNFAQFRELSCCILESFNYFSIFIQPNNDTTLLSGKAFQRLNRK